MLTELDTSQNPPVCRFVDVPASALDQAGRLVDDVIEQRIAGFVVRDALPPERVATLMSRIEAGVFDRPGGEISSALTMIPRALVTTKGDEQVRTYFEDAAPTRRAFDALFADGESVEQFYERILGPLSSRPPKLARRPEGGEYLQATVRRLVEGKEILLHCEMETMHFDGMRAIAPVINGQHCLSVYVGLQKAATGGELVVYDLVLGTPEAKFLEQTERTWEFVQDKVANLPHWRIRLGPGDLLFFNAGIYYHRVVPVEGPRPRWTLGSLAAVSRDEGALLYWG